jgi:hypothetical protein
LFPKSIAKQDSKQVVAMGYMEESLVNILFLMDFESMVEIGVEDLTLS